MKLHPKTQFRPTEEAVTALLKAYGLDLVAYKIADSGIENCTVIVQTPSRQYVLRVYRRHKKSDWEIQRELDFIGYLGQNGIPVALPVPSTNAGFVSHLDQGGYRWQAILMPFMPGSHASHYSDKVIGELATIQARMHNLAASYQTGEGPLESEYSELRETYFIPLIQDRQTLDPRLQEFIIRAENYTVSLDSTLPKGLCHLDFGNGNILTTNDAVTAVLDFDDLALAPYVMCLAYTLWDIAYDLGLGGSVSYTKAYERIRVLTGQEKHFIKPIMLFRHYVIGCMQVAHRPLNEATLARYLKLEHELLHS